MAAKYAVSLDKAAYDKLKAYAQSKNESLLKAAGKLLDKLLDDATYPIVLKIPLDIKSDKDKLKTWLDTRTAAIVEMLTRT